MRSSALAAALLLAGARARALDVETLAVAGIGPKAASVPVEVVRGEAMVRFDPVLGDDEQKSRLKGIGAADLGKAGSTGWRRVQLPAGLSTAQGLEQLKTVGGVLSVEPNHAYRALKVPSDPLVSSQYALEQVDAFAGWEYETGASNRVTIGVTDTGVDKTHPDLAAKFANTTNVFCDPGANKLIDDPDPACTTVPATANTDACGHGTEVAGVAAASANNGSAIAGMSWDAQLVALKIFRDGDCTPGCANAGCATDDWAIANALDYARLNYQNQAAYGKVVINLSVGGNSACPLVIQNAVTAAVGAGVVVVAAAGNSPGCSGTSVNSPGNCVGVIPAAATDATNHIASYSCSGPELATDGVAAPGSNVTTTASGGGTSAPSGTSFASPMVSGLAALVYAHKPTLTVPQIQAAIRAGAESIGASASAQGAGRINAFRTLRYADKGTLGGFDGQQKPVAFPNPYKPSESGVVSFAVPPSLQGADMKISVYTLDGQLVKELTSLAWNGKNTQGNAVASGSYVFVVKSSAGQARGRLAVLH